MPSHASRSALVLIAVLLVAAVPWGTVRATHGGAIWTDTPTIELGATVDLVVHVTDESGWSVTTADVRLACAPSDDEGCDIAGELSPSPASGTISGSGSPGRGADGEYSFHVTPSRQRAYVAVATIGDEASGSTISTSFTVVGDDFALGDINVPGRVILGDSFDVSSYLYYGGHEEALTTIDLIVNGALRETANYLLPPGGSQSVDFWVTPTVAGTYAISLRLGDRTHGPVFVGVVAPSAQFALGELQLPQSVDVGTEVHAIASLVNYGEASGETEARLFVNGALRDVVSRGLGPGEDTWLDFSFTPTVAGTYFVEIALLDGTRSQGSFEAIAPPTANIVLSDLVVPASVEVGSRVWTYVTITNHGGAEGMATLQFLVNNAQRDVRFMRVSPGMSEIVGFDFTPAVTGTYAVSMRLDDAMIGPVTLEVTQPVAPSFWVRGLAVPERADVGQAAIVSADIWNIGNGYGDTFARLYVDGDLSTARHVSLFPGESADVPLTFLARAPGVHAIVVEIADQTFGPFQVAVYPRPIVSLSDAESSPLVAGTSELVVEDAYDFGALLLTLHYDPSVLSFAGIAAGDEPGLAVSAQDDAASGTLTLFVASPTRGLDGTLRLATISWTAQRLDTQSTRIEPESVAYHTGDWVELHATATAGFVHTSLTGDALNAVLTPVSDALSSAPRAAALP